MAVDEQLFDADFLRRLRSLFFKLRRRRQLRKKGVQQTSAAGFSREFKDHRPYTSREDFRSIDWRLYARLEKLYVKVFEEIQEFHVHILVDRSRSMVEPFPEKRVTALRLAVGLAYLGLMNQHRVSLLSFGDDVRQELQPIRGQGHIHAVLRQLSGVEFAGATDLDKSLRHFRPGRDRRGIVFVLSDLLGSSPERSREALLRAVSWPAETHVVHILHPDEIRPKLDGEVQLIDVETSETRRLSLSKRELDRYTRAFESYVEELSQACFRRKIDYVTWTTERPFEEMFLGLLSRGSALAPG